MGNFDLLGRFVGFDEGTLSSEEYLELMGYIVANPGMFRTFPGRYVRAAMDAYNAGLIDGNGNVIGEIDA